ncbi:MAG TPA: exonuclease domain-containing protein [Azospira sp.]|nr:exonuclease domain-containing protein [Azospira sp.]
MMLARFFGVDFRRRRLLARAAAGPLRDYLATPHPAADGRCDATPFLALDLETTGGDPARDEIVSLGWVAVDGPRIDLGSARHRIVRLRGAMSPGSAVVHAITDDEAAAGVPLESALRELLAALAGRVLIAHHARTEVDFVDAACRRLYGSGIAIPAIDTLDLARRRLARLGQTATPGSLRLGALRREHHLPRYPAHNALSDALAAAELFLAQLAAAPKPPTLSDWLR